ncbi:hypothetical protein AB0D04_29265 [Streptomyces sp. NPDC048483]|uniref:hypothetical protein n=1 Tax=Streptomyces sp. NPDC048483 TaxID=3154927 RepID=UPI0034267B80
MLSREGHWHGYGAWVGSGKEYGREGLRRPGRHPGDEQTRAFLASPLPPMMVGHWLLRRDQTAAERTWTRAVDAVSWLKGIYRENLPLDREDGRTAYCGLHVKTAYALDALPRGVDVTWAYWMTSGSLTSYSVVACPNRPHPDIACPLPPD